MEDNEQERPTKAKDYTQFPRPTIDRGLSSARGTGDKNSSHSITAEGANAKHRPLII